VKRPPRRTEPDARVRVWSSYERAWLTGTVTEVRWDKWLNGGAWRVFVAIDGRVRDGQPIVETYFTDQDLDTSVPDLLDMLAVSA
jgi:hypothetical protein